MKRNFVSLIKFGLLTVLTVFLTIVVFRYLRHVSNSDATVAAAVDIAAAAADAADGQAGQAARPERIIGDNNNDNVGLIDSLPQQSNEETIDWHDYVKIEEEKKRRGIGEHGKPASLSPLLDKKKEKLYRVNGFNAALSDEISLNRSIPDIRHRDCRTKLYAKKLDSVSVIVSFHNEHFTTLLRTCWSVINRSPSHLLEEILLVDDASTKVELKEELDNYVVKYLPKVRIIRLAQRSGLIRGRLAGAREAKAKVLVFLDSHSEANVNWLPPLLDPISRNYKTCVCPFIDVIAYETFEYKAQDEGARGAFDWEFYYKRLPLLKNDLLRPSEPFKSPIMAGGLFAISAKFFWLLGGYDPGLDIWGGEQYELSFKIWQCGGQMYDAPCSRVGHIYRKFAPFPNPGIGDFLGKNYRRVAEVWMDEYAEYIYRRIPRLRALDPDDLTEQKALRKQLQCKSFKWFIENIAFDLVEVYPLIEPEDFADGEIRNVGASEFCLDIKQKTSNKEAAGKTETIIVVERCIKRNSKVKRESQQLFRLTWHKDIRPKSRTDCLDVSQSGEKAPVTLFPCHGKQGNQLWRYDPSKQSLKHGYSNQRCLDADTTARKVFVTTCDSSSATQKWRIENVNLTAIDNWDNALPKV